MIFFSRSSDIIKANLDDLLAEAGNPAEAIGRIIAEIEEGVAGMKRSVTNAASTEQRLQAELAACKEQVQTWVSKAREELGAGNEASARHALSRKAEVDDLLAGMELQLASAASTREHLTTTLRAIEARLAEARRKQETLTREGTKLAEHSAGKLSAGVPSPAFDRSRAAQIEAELDALRRELKGQ